MNRAQLRRDWRRAMSSRRRLLVTGLVAAAAAIGLHTFAPPAAATQTVVVAALDLPAGHALVAGDVRAAAWAVGTAPRGALSVVVGRVLASPLRAGEPVTDARVTGPGLLRGQPAEVRAVTIRVGDPASADMLRPGDRIDVLAGPEVVVEGGLVLAAGGAGDGRVGGEGNSQPGGSGMGSGLLGGAADVVGATSAVLSTGLPAGVLVLAVDRPTARRLAAVSQAQLLSVALLS